MHLTKVKGKIKSLQSILDNSEAVQRDFVKLSRSLQVNSYLNVSNVHLTKVKGEIQSLQSDLDNSEAVQRDFVKLSQSLEVNSYLNVSNMCT